MIEMMIVVAIIGLLTASSLLAYSKQRQQARDTKRKTDIASINTALQEYINTHLEPVTATSDNDSWDYSSQPATAVAFMTFLQSGGYITKVPLDPINNGLDNVLEGGTGYAYGYCYNVNACTATKESGYSTYVLKYKSEADDSIQGIKNRVIKK